jgi:hypothetical protein
MKQFILVENDGNGKSKWFPLFLNYTSISGAGQSPVKKYPIFYGKLSLTKNVFYNNQTPRMRGRGKVIYSNGALLKNINMRIKQKGTTRKKILPNIKKFQTSRFSKSTFLMKNITCSNHSLCHIWHNE